MSELSRFPPRLHVLLARDAPVGLVIRRGPSKFVATIGWDRSRDTFQLGQWLKGRIYERRSDLSPDGKHVIYFAMNGKWDSESRGAWTAISRAPYLKAVTFLPKGDCWNGGGLWTSDDTYWLNDGYGHSTALSSESLSRDEECRPKEFGGECPGVYYPRLLRDGWRLARRKGVRRSKSWQAFDKKIGHGWTLRKIAHAEIGAPVGKSVSWDEHELIGPEKDQTLPCPDWEWADLDGERLVWAANGRLHAARVGAGGLSEERELHDFNDMEFEPIEAPY